MGKSNRKPMSVSERAKQFMPFAAVKGLEEALEEKEREQCLVEKAELSDDQMEEITRVIEQMTLKTLVAVTYYHNGIYENVTGIYGGINKMATAILVAATLIPIDDIYTIKECSVMS